MTITDYGNDGDDKDDVISKRNFSEKEFDVLLIFNASFILRQKFTNIPLIPCCCFFFFK